MVNVSDLGFGVAGALDHDVVRVVARRLEQEGFRTLWINDTPDGDSLAGLAAAAGETSTIRLATGVISIDRRSPDVIARAVRGHRLPEHRLVIGIGAAAKPRPLERVENALDAIRAELSCRTMVGALGPKMRRLAAQHSDGVLLNWLTPEAARDAVADMRRDAEYAGTDVESCLYVRSALGPVASERMVQEAESHAEEDKKRREAIDTRNQAESFVFQAEKTLEDYGDKIDSETRADLDTKIAAVKDILENDRENIERLKPAHDELVEALQKASTAMYEAAAAAGAEGQPGDMGGDPFGGNGATDGTAPSDDDATVEGEFREVGADDDKKQS